MSIEKYYQQYLIGEEVKKIIKKYSTSGNKHELTKEANKVIYFSKIFDSKAKHVIKEFIMQEITSKASLIATDANKMIDELLICVYTTPKGEKPGKVSKTVDTDVVLSYKDFSITLGKCHYDVWSSKTTDDIITSQMMSDFFIIETNRRSDYIIEPSACKLIKSVISDFGIKKVYELCIGFYRSAATEIHLQTKLPVELRTLNPELDKDFGSTGGIFATEYDDNSFIFINLFSPKLVQYYLLDNIFSNILKNKKNITIAMFYYTRLQEEHLYTLEFPETSRVYQPLNTTIDCTTSQTPGIQLHVRFISNDQKVIHHIEEYE